MDNNPQNTITLGRVIDTNDPKQMGRVRVVCKSLGDTDDMLVGDIPWATYISPIAGFSEHGPRGRNDEDITAGPVAYGMWNIPKKGAIVAVTCLEGDPRFRIYFGCVHGELMTHTMPHGRFSVRDDIIAQESDSLADLEGKPIGPFSSREEAIQPLFDKIREMFTFSLDTIDAGIPDTPQINFEYITRGADRSVSRLTEETSFASEASFSRDDTEDDKYDDLNLINSQGYQQSRSEPDLTYDSTGKNYDSQIYSWTTPGFHSISMDDSPTNCRVRFRTTHGQQIILDDTNERIYVSTAGGKTWIELDEKGNIDFYANRNISFHAEKDINFTTEKTFRVKAKEGIHLASEIGDIRMHSKVGDIHIKSDQDVQIHAAQEILVESVGNLHISTQAEGKISTVSSLDVSVTGGTLYLETSANVDIKSGGATIIESTGNLNLKSSADTMLDAGGINNVLAGGNLLLTGAQVHANGPPAASATSGTGATTATGTTFKESWWTNRIPEHEPWPRVMTLASKTDVDVDNTHAAAAEYPYDDENVGKIERGDDLNRNDNWHR